MFVTIRSYTNSKKAEYIKYCLERSGIECNTITDNDIVKIEVRSNKVEGAVDELLKIQAKYPNEDFELITEPAELLRILIPVDFSEKSLEASKYAIDIAYHRPVEIKFLHVWNDEIDDFMAVKSSREIEEFKRLQRNELNREIEKNLESFRVKFKQLLLEKNINCNLLYHFTIAEGIWGKQMEKEIYRFQPQLAITGHNDNKKWKFRISRAVANSIINLAYCPVFYIPQKVYHQPLGDLHIMYATNFDECDMKSYESLQEMAKGYATSIHFMHVCYEQIEKETEVKMAELIKKMNSSNKGEIKIHSKIISNSNLIKGFESYIEENKIDMIAFTSPEHGVWHKLFNPDNLKSLMKGSLLPLLIFRYK